MNFTILFIISLALGWSLGKKLNNSDAAGFPSESLEKALGKICNVKDIKVARAELTLCVMRSVNINKLMNSSSWMDTLSFFFNEGCSESFKLKNCVQPFLTTLAPCINNTAIENVVSTLNKVISDILVFACENKGKNYKELLGASQCVETVHSMFMEDHVPECIRYGTMFIPVLDMKESAQQRVCNLLKTVNTCITPFLNTCVDKTLRDLFQKFLNFIRPGLSCSFESTFSEINYLN